MFVDFIGRPSSRPSALLIVLAAASIPALPIAQYPQLAPPQVTGHEHLHRRERPGRREPAVTTPLEQQINGVEGMRYMTSTSGNDGTQRHHRHLRRRARPGPRRRRRAEPGDQRLAAPAHARSSTGVTVTKTSTPSILLAWAFYARRHSYDARASSATTPTSTCATRSSA